VKRVKQLRIVVAAPLDTWAEADILEDVVTEFNLGYAAERGFRVELVRWNMSTDMLYSDEDFPSSLLRVHECDLLVGIFWKRFSYGKIGSKYRKIFDSAYGTYQSEGHPEVWLFFNERPYLLTSSDEAVELYEVLKLRGRLDHLKYRARASQKSAARDRFYWTYKGTAQFSKLIRKELTRFIRDRIDSFGSRSGRETVNPVSSAKEAAPAAGGIESAYIVYTTVASLSDYPFQPPDSLRPIWRPIFKHKRCFSSSPELLWDRNCWEDYLYWSKQPPGESNGFWRRHLPMHPLQSKPFIRGLGSIRFDTRSVHFEHQSHRRKELLYHLRGEKLPWPDGGHSGLDLPSYHAFNPNRPYFGYEPELSDQRMNYLHYEIRKPLRVRATEGVCGAQAAGKIFIHIYPSGYIVLHLALTLGWQNGVSLTDIRQALHETSPGLRKSLGQWSSRLHNGTLFEITERVLACLQRSFYTEGSRPLRLSSWRAAVKFSSSAQYENIAAALFSEEGDYKYLLPRTSPMKLRAHVQAMLVSRSTLACVFEPDCGRRSSLKVFWNIVDLHEFVALKRRMYEDYAEHLRDQILQLGLFRRSLKRKATEEDLLRFTVYDETIPIFLANLDKQVRLLSPFYRYMYSLISAGTRFDELREKVKKYVSEWQEEVDQWEHPLAALWKKVLSPLRSVFGPLKGKI
jgi:hypothetical protein